MFDERINDHNDVEGLANGLHECLKMEMEKGRYDFISFEPYGFKYIKFVTKGRLKCKMCM